MEMVELGVSLVVIAGILWGSAWILEQISVIQNEKEDNND
jgi:hypothetical protein